jgi:uncharacterized protein YjbJ (UPF0337 family)
MLDALEGTLGLAASARDGVANATQQLLGGAAGQAQQAAGQAQQAAGQAGSAAQGALQGLLGSSSDAASPLAASNTAAALPDAGGLPGALAAGNALLSLPVNVPARGLRQVGCCLWQHACLSRN